MTSGMKSTSQSKEIPANSEGGEANVYPFLGPYAQAEGIRAGRNCAVISGPFELDLQFHGMAKKAKEAFYELWLQ